MEYAFNLKFKLAPGDRVLASMLKQPLMVAREQSGRSGSTRRSVAIGFDLRQSDLPLRVAFPVLLMNAVDWFAGDVDDDLGSYRTGRTWRVPLLTARKGGRGGAALFYPKARRNVCASFSAELRRSDSLVCTSKTPSSGR